jgi:GntR family transcriptional regulator, rspAB operon transcriptional repressor
VISLKEKAYIALLDRLLKNSLYPGQLINRRSIAQELNISVAPVLEAMLQLETEGFLEALPRKGTRVRLVRLDDVRGHLIVREAIECEAARLYCGNQVRSHQQELEDLATQVDQSYGSGLENWENEIHFHQRLVELSDCRALLEEFKRVMRLGFFYQMHVVFTVEEDKNRSLHQPLVKDLCTDDPDEAERIIRTHMRTGKSGFHLTEQKLKSSGGETQAASK